MDDIDYMQEAIDLATRGEGFTAPNPVVGAVVVSNGEVVGRGWHAAAGKPHAEVMAIEAAGPRARSADLYVTLEPCNHTGRTPPCTRKILEAGIGRVVVALRDPNPDVAGGGIEYLRARGVAVTEGVGQRAVARQLDWFVKYIRTKLPFVTLKCAMTLDGRIATRTGDSRWVTGEASRAFVHRLRHAADAIMIGAGTLQADHPRLTARLEGRPARDPVRIVLDTRLSIDEDAALLHLQSDAKTMLVAGPGHDPDKRRRLEASGVHVVEAAMESGRVDLAALMERLGGMGITSLLLEGGARVAGSALAAGIVDKVCLFYAPRILGGDDGVPMCRGAGPAQMADALPVHHLRVRRFDRDVMMEGYLRSCLPES
ncbi:MAG: bifunctional diaminohydroxyphosphoribosylaminopyrimidine deaminase/5-amino-6-(5-phosphoribosylamino)uracil reductase RibD [Desulfosudaceae bacterium]